MNTVTVIPSANQQQQLSSDFLRQSYISLLQSLNDEQASVWHQQVLSDEITPATVRKIRQVIGFSNGLFQPRCLISKGLACGFDSQRQRIFIGEGYLYPALVDSGRPSALLAHILLEEYGHLIDYILRYQLSELKGDSLGDEGARFAFAMADFLAATTAQIEFAEYRGTGGQLLSVASTQLKNLYTAGQRQAMVESDQRTGDLRIEYFSAGRGDPVHNKFGHWSIEDAMSSAGFSQEQIDQVYYGNWLRDYSQVVDPKLVEFQFQGRPFFTRAMLTEVVQLLAELEFEPQGFFTGPQRQEFVLTEARLGLYRPEEHIDNPYGITASQIPGFRGAYNSSEGQIDPLLWRKSYFDQSISYIVSELNTAVSAGATAEGRRHFGQAMHTLEDLYAHSNYVELIMEDIRRGLIQGGVTPAWPSPKLWTTEVSVNGADGNLSVPPLVTGSFAFVDTVASVISIIEKHFDHPAVCTPGERAAGTRIALIMVRNHDAQMGATFEQALVVLEQVQAALGLDWLSQKICEIKHTLFGWIKALMAAALRVAMNVIPQHQQTPPTDPTHTQIAKDPDDHPLHPLTASVARTMARQMSALMQQCWSGAATAAQLEQQVRHYFVHPFQAAALGNSEVNALRQVVQGYIDDTSHQGALQRAATYGGHEHHHADGTTENLQQLYNAVLEIYEIVRALDLSGTRLPTLSDLQALYRWSAAQTGSVLSASGGSEVGQQLQNIGRSLPILRRSGGQSGSFLSGAGSSGVGQQLQNLGRDLTLWR
ncbi:HET-C-related protein [Amphritea sp.]|uniref:HET-C-related protein n=1 Tax=Amphritea sp. TaxID=1872502 RepID=UPI003D0F5F9C